MENDFGLDTQTDGQEGIEGWVDIHGDGWEGIRQGWDG